MTDITSYVFGQRFCTRCGQDKMYYYMDGDGYPYGSCSCGNIDYCNGETVERVKKRLGEELKPVDIDALKLHTF